MVVDDYENIKNNIVMLMVNINDIKAEPHGKELIDHVPHEVLGDILTIYGAVVPYKSGKVEADFVTNEFLEETEIPYEQFKEDAMECCAKYRPAFSMSVNELKEHRFKFRGKFKEYVKNLDDNLADNIFMVTTKRDKYHTEKHGAVVLYYPDFLEMVAQKVGGSFYVGCPYDDKVWVVANDVMSLDEIKDFMNHVVSKASKLSNEIFYYDYELKEFGVVPEFEQGNFLDEAKDLIDSFIEKEFDDSNGADYHDLSKIPFIKLSADGENTLGAFINLNDYTICKTMNDEIIDKREFKNFRNLIKNGLTYESLKNIVDEITSDTYSFVLSDSDKNERFETLEDDSLDEDINNFDDKPIDMYNDSFLNDFDDDNND